MSGSGAFNGEAALDRQALIELAVNESNSAVYVTDGEFKQLAGVLENTTESRQIQSLQRDVLEAIAQEMPLVDVMTTICERVEAMFPEVVCSILAVDHDKRLRPLAAPSLPEHYNR